MGAPGPEAEVAAIRQLIDAYGDAVFRRDASDWGACWAEDACWSLAGQVVEGRDEIVALWKIAMAGFPFVAFFAQPGLIVVDGERASGRVYTHELLEKSDGTIDRPIGRYDDEYRKIEGAWRFAARTYILLHKG
jgi:ketosteroid isomerase-like protein